MKPAVELGKIERQTDPMRVVTVLKLFAIEAETVDQE